MLGAAYDSSDSAVKREKESPMKKRETKPVKGPAWASDHDEAHFSDNPAVKKPRTKKRVKSTGRPTETLKMFKAEQAAKKTTRKRIAGK
jgi:hypothetical protein